MEENDKNVKLSDDETHASSSLDTDKSILDFRSPKKGPIEKIKLFNFKSTKCKRNQAQLKINVNNSIDNKPGTSKQVQRKISNDTHLQADSNMSGDQENESKNLPSNAKIAYVCPLCFKNFKDNNGRTLHMKKCATKKKVSVKKLLQAMELQERQTAERVSLGLPYAPILQNKKQSFIRKMSINEDSQLQLALALSKSLYEVEEIKNSSETEQSFITANIKNEVENQPITSRLPKRKKQNIISVLQIRSQEERDRLLTEKIAEILIDNETLIQRQQQAMNEKESTKKDNLRSHVLKELLNFDNKLWNTATLQESQSDFYVTDLSSYIIPSEQKLPFMENANKSNIVSKSQQKGSSVTEYDSYPHKEESSSTSHNVDVKLFADMKKENIKQSSISSMIADWGNALNDSSSSDVIIFVNGGKHIWVHKLVFYVRCPNILLDIIPNENEVYSVKERICWADIEYYIALTFLEFIYCGIIEKYSISSNDSTAMSSLGRLARRYKIKELFSYLRHEHIISYDKASKDRIFETDEQDIQEIYCSNDGLDKLELTIERNVNVVKCNDQDTFDVTTIEVPHDQLLKTNISPEKYTIHDLPTDRSNCVSPDIFDDIDSTTLNYANNIKFTNIEDSENNIKYDPLSPNQCNLENVTTNELSSPPLANRSRSSTDEYMLNNSIMASTKINQVKQVSDIMIDKVKQKGDLTLFIEEIQKENAKSDFEIDSKMDSPVKSFIQRNRNPFRKTEYNESSIISDKLDSFEFSPTKAGEKLSRLSKLESDMQIHAIKNPQLYNITIIDNLKCTTFANHNSTDLSSPVRDINVSVACNDEKSEIIQSVQETSVSMASYSSSEMDTDDADISMYTKYKKKHIDNSIAVYRSALKTHKNNMTEIKTDKRKNNEIITSDHIGNFNNITKRIYNINHTRRSLSDMDMDENIGIIRMKKDTSNLNFSKESRNETEIFNTLVNNSSQSTESFKKQKTNNWSNDELIVSWDNNSLKTQITTNASSNDDYSNILNLHSPVSHNTKEQHSSPLKSPIDSNPIIISSSPDIDANSVDNYNSSKYNNQRILNSRTQEFDDDDLQHFFLNKTSFSNANIENKIGGVTLENSAFQIFIKNKRLRKRSKSEGSLQLNYSIEKDYEIGQFSNISLRQDNKQDNYESNVKNRLFTITESYDISPPNYNVMDTPKLHREMKKYGLKIQNRKRAIKLLTHIYNELHPTITSCEILGACVENIYNEDEEPQRKRLKTDENLSNKYNNIEYECDISSIKTLDSKEYLKKTEITTDTNVSIENIIALNDCISINEAFFKLISFNKDLHNQILRYEPLNIELIHCMLKTGGFKCKINALIDFLDEQCITFYLPENKNKARTRKVHN